MATETVPATTTRPARKRATAAVAKPAVVEPKAPVAPAVGEDGLMRVQFALETQGDTKTYSKFTPPASSGCVGTLYVPHGTQEVKVLLIGPANAE